MTSIVKPRSGGFVQRSALRFASVVQLLLRIWDDEQMPILGCSGPGAGEAIAGSIKIGFEQAALVGSLLLASVLLRLSMGRRCASIEILLALLIFHPAWTVRAIGGDCGHTKRDLSWLFTALGI